MSPVSVWPAVVALAMAVSLGYVLSIYSPVAAKPHRYQSIDGLRGYLAFAVFLHHASIWYFYLHGSPWAVPPSHLYTHFGQTGVALFFMITGLLFYSKILDSRARRFDWTRLYVSRLMRLTPLYLLTMAVMLAFVAKLSSDVGLREPLWRVALEVARWLTFTLTGSPDINGVPETGNTVALVVWSLRYEWLFYAVLPLIAVAVDIEAGAGLLALAAASFLALIMIDGPPVHVASFLVGMVAAVASRFPSVTRLAKSASASALATACLVAAVTLYASPYSGAPFTLVAVVFVVISCGNTFWGGLTSRPSRALGDLSYGIYLLHGLVLFAAFTFVLKREESRALDPFEHWSAVLVAAPLVILLSAAAYRWVEKPAIDATDAVTSWCKGFGRGSNRSQAS